MSRITDGPVKDGDSLSAASLNDRFASYTQTDLNAFNHRDAAHDLPQFDTGWMLTHAQAVQIGKPDWKHSAYVTVNGQTVLPALPHPVEDGAGTPTVMSFGAGLTISPGEVFRAYWNLSVFAGPGSNWNTAGSLGFMNFDNGSGGTRAASTWGAVWVTFLQWDVTDATLTNWVEVPGQSDFNTAIGAKFGSAMGNTEATAVVPADLRHADGPSQGTLPNASVQRSQRWRGVSGAWYSAPGATRTVYGLRVVIKGIMHPWNSGGVNYLVHDPTYSTDAFLRYNAGSLSVLKHRVQ
jgi:hypothetical protein